MGQRIHAFSIYIRTHTNTLEKQDSQQQEVELRFRDVRLFISRACAICFLAVLQYRKAMAGTKWEVTVLEPVQ